MLVKKPRSTTKKTTPKAKKKKTSSSYPAGGYGNPKPRKKRLDQAGDWRKPKKKK